MKTYVTKFLFLFFLINPPQTLAKKGGGSSIPLRCSTTQKGAAVINEVNTKNNFVEIYLLQSTDILNWALFLDDSEIQNLGHGNCSVNGSKAMDNSGTGANKSIFPSGTYIVCTNKFNPSNNEVLIVDKSGSPSGSSVIDYLSYGKPTPNAIWSVPSDCGTLYPEHQASNKDIARTPDGSGPLVDNDNNSTLGTTNGGESPKDTTATSFNCVESGTDGINGRLYTKTTDQSFSFDIVALKDDSYIEASFASGADHIVTVELVDANTGNGSCANYSALDPAVSQNLVFSSSDSGIKTSNSMTSSTAYRAVKCRITDATIPPTVVGCSTDSFAIRPTTFTVTSNLTNTGSTGIPKAKAGEAFTLTGTATKGYTGIPSIDQSKIEAHAGALNIGDISGTFNAASFSAGNATGSAFTYSEVGSLRFIAEGIYDDSFTAIDQPGDCTDNFSDTQVAGKIGCKFGNKAVSDYFGRFTPDHFSLDTASHTLACVSFNYMEQPFLFNYSISARNSSDAITQNYHGNFVKMSSLDFVAEQSGSLNNRTPKSYDLNKDSMDTPSTPLTRLKSPYKDESLIYDKSGWFEGKYIVAKSTTTFLRDSDISLIDGPFNSLDIGVQVIDDDGINFDSLDMQANVNNDTCTMNTPNDCPEKKFFQQFCVMAVLNYKMHMGRS